MKHTLLLPFVISVCLTACSDDVITMMNGSAQAGEFCRESLECADHLECLDGICKTSESEDPLTQDMCGEKTCQSDEVCLDEACIAKSKLCGNVLCKSEETCIDKTCVSKRDLCNGTLCDKNEICVENVCMPKGDCGGIACNQETEYCLDDTCFEKTACGEGYCEGDEYCVNETCVKSSYCIVDATRVTRCGDECCQKNAFCGAREHCCSFSNRCGHDCCQEGEVCENELCHLLCVGSTRCELDDGREICCEAGQVCVANQCFTPPDIHCVDNYMCEPGQICDPQTNQCLPHPKGEVCKADPVGGEVQPTLLWHWGAEPPNPFPDYAQVMSSPMVADINNDTIPEVAFNSYKTGNNWDGNGILRVVNGQTGVLLASSDGNPFTDGGSMVAVGNLDDDAMLELVTCAILPGTKENNHRLIAYKYVKGDSTKGTVDHLEVMWKSEASYNECGQSGPGIADFNGDGKAEVYGRYTIHNGQTGEVLAHVACGDTAQPHRPCDYSVALDLDGDGQMELVGGNVVFTVELDNADESKRMTPLWQRTDQQDGLPAVANIDADVDNTPELVVVRPNERTLMAFDAWTGENFWETPVQYYLEAKRAGGAPNIANLDDDPQLEISFAGRNGNFAFNHDGTILWQRGSRDESSGVTGSTVFDFDGDGKAEVVYADEDFLRVYDGKTGETIYCQCNTNCTHYEYPVVADVNADGHAEIIISANQSCNFTKCRAPDETHGKDACTDAIIEESKTNPSVLNGTQGVRAFSSPKRDWVNTRKVYNQHAYNITNVSDDGSIPKRPKLNWKTQGLNNFRLNVQPGATYLPDLEIANVSSPYSCIGNTPLYFDVKNVGWSTAMAGIPVHIWYINTQGENVLAGTIKTTKDLPPGAYESLQFPFTHDETTPQTTYITLKLTDDIPTECRTDNNQTTYEKMCPIY